MLETESQARRDAQSQSRDAEKEATKEKMAREEAESRVAVAIAKQTDSEKRLSDLERQIAIAREAKTAAEPRAERDKKTTEGVGGERNKTDKAISTFSREQSATSSEAEATPAPQDVTRRSFDWGDVVATPEWARLGAQELEVSVNFVNRSQRTLWIIPASRRSEGGIQASDNVKNNYDLKATGGFKRQSENLRADSPRVNQFLELQPSVPSPATFTFVRGRLSIRGATEVRFFATLTIIEDRQTLKSYNRALTATLNLK
ncbi:MAG TPA: hypothetical protein VJU77_15060 [Chthoniobacterales bacterium]|nr:hypothetical protein [Chthoniobacterales bacterium]